MACQTPTQLIFFDSTVHLAVDEAMAWAVHAFAEVLKAWVWATVEPGKQLNDNAFVTILRQFQNDLCCTSVAGHAQADHTASFLASGLTMASKKPPEQEATGVVMNIGDAVRAYKLKLLHLSKDVVESEGVVGSS
jgi:hypothetical protein